VNWATADGTATAASDYTAASGALSFAAGETTKTLTVAVQGDVLDEADETFAVNLSGAVNATVAESQGVGTITDDDATPSLAINNVTVVEGNSGTINAVFTVTLSSASGRSVTVNYATTNGTATAPSDYTAATGALTFAAGETSKTVIVVVKGDTLEEADETFFVDLSGATNASVATSRGTGTILNDDTNQPPTVSITRPVNRATFPANEAILIEAVATDPDGFVSQVEFYVGTTLLGADTTSPFSFEWADVPNGTYVLTANATDNRGATSTSAPVSIVVTDVSGDVAIVRNRPDEEIEQMEEYLFELGLASHVFDAPGLTFEVLAKFQLVIWDDLGTLGLTDADVTLFKRIYDSGKPLYFIGEALAFSTTSLSAAQQAVWTELIQLKAGGGAGGSGSVSIDTFEGHPVVINGRVGTVSDFVYPVLAHGSTLADSALALVLGRTGDKDVVLAYEDPLTGVRTVTQTLQVIGGADAASLAERKKLFQNAVWWLLNRGCGLTDLSITISASADQVQVGETITYTLVVQHAGECPGVGVRLYDPLPDGVAFVSADSTRGTWTFVNGVVTFNLGYISSAQQVEATVVVTAVTPGVVTNIATVRNAGPEVNPENNITDPPAVTEILGAAAALAKAERAVGEEFELELVVPAGRKVRIETSSDLVHWVPWKEVTGTGETVWLPDPESKQHPRRFYRVVSP